MGIEKFIQKVCVQTAVYWGNPTSDGYGDYTFDTAVEISCRWDSKRLKLSPKLMVVSGGASVELVSEAEVMVTQDLDVGGYLYLGELDDLSAAEKANPKLVDDAFQIVKFDKISMIKSTTEFVRKAYL